MDLQDLPEPDNRYLGIARQVLDRQRQGAKSTPSPAQTLAKSTASEARQNSLQGDGTRSGSGGTGPAKYAADKAELRAL